MSGVPAVTTEQRALRDALIREGLLIDIPGESIAVAGVPTPPPGLSVDRVDVVVRVRRN